MKTLLILLAITILSGVGYVGYEYVTALQLPVKVGTELVLNGFNGKN